MVDEMNEDGQDNELTYVAVEGAEGPTVDRASYDAWKQSVIQVGKYGTGVPWALGDLLVEGERKFGEDYAAVIPDLEAYSYKPATLTQFLFVAKNVPGGENGRRRVGVVDWSHHKEVASLTAEQQVEWLEACERDQLSVKTLREKLKAAGLRKSRASTPRTCEGCTQYAEQVAAMQAIINDQQDEIEGARAAVQMESAEAAGA